MHACVPAAARVSAGVQELQTRQTKEWVGLIGLIESE